jgi:signal peptidase I
VTEDENDHDMSTPTASTPDFDFPTERVLGTEKPRSKSRGAIEWAIVIVGAVVAALLIKTFLLQAFYIPSKSMVPTLNVGDRVLVNKLSYKVHDVNRGDIVVFERPDAETATDDIEDLIKRVIGLPGDKIVIKGGSIFINDQLLQEPYLPAGTQTGPGPTYPCTEASPCRVPEGDVFVMGDNRSDSRDSRWFGPIDEDKIVGRAFFRVWPLNQIGFL